MTPDDPRNLYESKLPSIEITPSIENNLFYCWKLGFGEFRGSLGHESKNSDFPNFFNSDWTPGPGALGPWGPGSPGPIGPRAVLESARLDCGLQIADWRIAG